MNIATGAHDPSVAYDATPPHAKRGEERSSCFHFPKEAGEAGRALLRQPECREARVALALDEQEDRALLLLL